jgi:hypothetical protein
MPIVFRCECGQRISVPDGTAGKRARCPKCGRVATIPSDRAAESAPPAPTPGERRYVAPPRDTPSGPASAPAKQEPMAAEPDSLVGRTCGICQTPIGAGEPACICPACRSPYHRECWDEIGGCAVYGCERMPETVKAQPEEGEGPQGWGDEKTCPRCGKTIRSMAVKCRFCKARFPSGTPMTPAEYREWAATQARLRPARTHAIIVFVCSLIGCLAPVVFPVAAIWLWRTRDLLAKVGGIHQILAYGAVILSAFYCIVWVMVILL